MSENNAYKPLLNSKYTYIINYNHKYYISQS